MTGDQMIAKRRVPPWGAIVITAIVLTVVAALVGLVLLIRPPAHTMTPAPGSPVTVPLFVENGHIALNVLVEGQPVRMVFDSGAGGMLMSSATAADLGLRTEASKWRVGVKDKIPARLAPAVSYRVGKLEFRLPTFVAGSGPPILGVTAMMESVIGVDINAAKLTIMNPADFRPTPKTMAFPWISRTQDVGKVDIVMNGHAAKADFDTGSNFALLVSSSMADAMGVERRPVVGSLRTAAGETRATLGVLRSLTLAAKRLENVPVLIDDEGAMGMDVVLGTPILEHFRVYLDYPNGRIWFEPIGG